MLYCCHHIISAQQAYTNLVQFVWSRANSKCHLYFDKPTELESGKHFSGGGFLNKLFNSYFRYPGNATIITSGVKLAHKFREK